MAYDSLTRLLHFARGRPCRSEAMSLRAILPLEIAPGMRLALADGQQNRVQQWCSRPAHDFTVRTLELFRACRGQKAVPPWKRPSAAPFPSAGSGPRWRCFHRQLHFSRGRPCRFGQSSFVDLCRMEICADAVAFADGQQDRVQHGVHAAHDSAYAPLELFRPCHGRKVVHLWKRSV